VAAFAGSSGLKRLGAADGRRVDLEAIVAGALPVAAVEHRRADDPERRANDGGLEIVRLTSALLRSGTPIGGDEPDSSGTETRRYLLNQFHDRLLGVKRKLTRSLPSRSPSQMSKLSFTTLGRSKIYWFWNAPNGSVTP